MLLQPRLLLVYAMTAVGYGGSLIAFTFLAPILQDLAGFNPNMVGAVLLAYGVSVAIGNIWGGRLADKRGPVSALKIIFGLLASVLLVLTFTAGNPWLVVLTVLAWGAVAFGNVPGLQVYVVQQAERVAPDAVDKYMNSPESKEFLLKEETLYNYHRIKNDVRNEGKVIILEGFMDVIALYKAGIKNILLNHQVWEQL